jgi:diguanylate cyclase (GGDEF)-like protein
MATQITLIIGAVLLACGSAGLYIVRLTNSRLLGLGWLGASFATGSIGAVLLFSFPYTSFWLNVVLADVLILNAFVVLHVAVLELTESDSQRPVLGVVLLLLQAVADLCLIYFQIPNRFRTVVVGILVALQAGQTSMALVRPSRRAISAPFLFSAILLVGFTCFNVGLSVAIALGMLNEPTHFYDAKVVTYVIYIAVALGMAFGFFWMTATKLTEKLEKMASTDPLTRVYNRRVFLDWCARELTRAERSGSQFSILMIDLDHFKSINDTFGHHIGDEMLIAVVEKIQDSVRGIDILGRWGGEEFAVLLPGASLEAALIVAQRVRTNIEKIVLQTSAAVQQGNPAEIVVTASVGVADFRNSRDHIADVMQRADAALYQAKAEGRNRVLSIT